MIYEKCSRPRSLPYRIAFLFLISSSLWLTACTQVGVKSGNKSDAIPGVVMEKFRQLYPDASLITCAQKSLQGQITYCLTYRLEDPYLEELADYPSEQVRGIESSTNWCSLDAEGAIHGSGAEKDDAEDSLALNLNAGK